MHIAFFVALVFIGCCSNVVFLELLTNKFPGSGNLITFAQFLFISVKGFIQESKFGTRKPKIPISKYMTLVVMFFIVSVLNNYALNFNISMPLHMIFRSGSLIANMILGVIILKKKYTAREIFSVILISVGIFLCTFASSKEIIKSKSTDKPEDTYANFLWWLVGITMLTVALLLSAGMGIVQEKLYQNHGKYPDEALFYIHVLTLPAFALLYQDLANQSSLFNQSTKFDLILISVPIIWIFLILNTLTQYVCISSVFVLTTECTSLTVNIVLTLRKFTSLIISIIYFQNPFTLMHWCGTIMVFLGTFLFTDLYGKYKESKVSKEKKSE